VAIHFQETTEQLDILGRVADFCPICRALRACTVRQTNLVQTRGTVIVGIPFFEQVGSQLLGYDRVCETCNLDLPTALQAYDRIVPAGGDETVAILMERTNPGLPEKVAGRRHLEQRILAGTLQPEERQALLLEPFHLLDHRLGRVMGRPRARWWTPTMLVLPMIGFLLAGLDSWIPQTGREITRVLSVLMIVPSVPYWLGRSLRSMYRSGNVNQLMSIEIDPLLARELKPLAPTEQELEEILATLRTKGLVSGRLLRPARILAEMECLH
jgi:hypothetical protein